MAKKAPEAKTRVRVMSDEHKAALAEGREQGRVIRRYLQAIESHRPKRGRRRSTETVVKRLAGIDEQLGDADPLRRLQLVQERMDLEAELAGTAGEGEDLEALEAAFVEVAAGYGERKGLTYEAWRSAGVAPRVLAAAGIGRGR